MEEKNKENKPLEETKKPLAKIKNKNIIIIGAGIALILIWALYKMGARQQEEAKKSEKEQVAESQVTTVDNLGFDIVDYTKTKSEEEEEVAKPLGYGDNVSSETETSPEEENIPNEVVEVKKNEKLEEYYNNLLSDELSARSAVIEFGIDNSKRTDEGQLPNINIDGSGTDLSKFQQRESVSDDINKQAEKKAFLSENSRKVYNEDTLKPAISKFEVKAGGIIPGIMLTGINSDLPGTMTASVREDVYDTVTGKYLLIPKGTRVTGKYSSAISFGQSRVLVVWQRLIYPNGKSINLENFEGADMSGYSGLVGNVDNHTLKLFQGVVLSSILGAAAGIIDNGGNGTNTSWKNNAGKGAGEEIVSIGEAIASRLLAVQPTIKIQPGARFNIMVNSDLVLEPYKR